MSQELYIRRSRFEVYQSIGVDLANPPELDRDYCSCTKMKDLDTNDEVSDKMAGEKIRAQIRCEEQMFPDKYFEKFQMLILTAIGTHFLEDRDFAQVAIKWNGAGDDQTEDITNEFRTLCESAGEDLHQLSDRGGILTFEACNMLQHLVMKRTKRGTGASLYLVLDSPQDHGSSITNGS